MVVNHSYVSYMAQMAHVDSTRQSLALVQMQFVIFLWQKLKEFMCSWLQTLSLEIGDKMLCSTHIYKSFL